MLNPFLAYSVHPSLLLYQSVKCHVVSCLFFIIYFLTTPSPLKACSVSTSYDHKSKPVRTCHIKSYHIISQKIIPNINKTIQIKANPIQSNPIVSKISVFVPQSLAYIYFHVLISLFILGCQIRSEEMQQHTTTLTTTHNPTQHNTTYQHKTTHKAHICLCVNLFFMSDLCLSVLSCHVLFLLHSISLSFPFRFLIGSHEKISKNNQVVIPYARTYLFYFFNDMAQPKNQQQLSGIGICDTLLF